MPDGNCADADITFDENPEEFKRLCMGCPVERTCLHYGLLTDDRHYTLGGTSPKDRANMDNGQRYTVCSQCMTGFTWIKKGRMQPTLCPACHPAGAIASTYPTGDPDVRT